MTPIHEQFFYLGPSTVTCNQRKKSQITREISNHNFIKPWWLCCRLLLVGDLLILWLLEWSFFLQETRAIFYHQAIFENLKHFSLYAVEIFLSFCMVNWNIHACAFSYEAKNEVKSLDLEGFTQSWFTSKSNRYISLPPSTKSGKINLENRNTFRPTTLQRKRKRVSECT